MDSVDLKCLTSNLNSSWVRFELLGQYYTGQRCSGRNYEGKRCCTPEQPCEEGEGDCDGRGDGGLNDGDRGCKGDLVCGSNNCLKFGLYYHKKDDCCEKSGSSSTTTTWKPHPDKPILPPEGRYYQA